MNAFMDSSMNYDDEYKDFIEMLSSEDRKPEDMTVEWVKENFENHALNCICMMRYIDDVKIEDMSMESYHEYNNDLYKQILDDLGASSDDESDESDDE